MKMTTMSLGLCAVLMIAMVPATASTSVMLDAQPMEGDGALLGVRTATVDDKPLEVRLYSLEDGRVRMAVTYGDSTAVTDCEDLSECIDEIIGNLGDIGDIILELAGDIIRAIKEACGHYCETINRLISQWEIQVPAN